MGQIAGRRPNSAAATPNLENILRDEEDRGLIATGRYGDLLVRYQEAITGRCRARVHGPSADDVVQAVFERLWGELKRGKTYTVPFRVVVHQVIGWKIAEHFADAHSEAEWNDVADEGIDPLDAWETRYDLLRAFDRLPVRQRQAATMRFLNGYDYGRIASELGIKANAAYQAVTTRDDGSQPEFHSIPSSNSSVDPRQCTEERGSKGVDVLGNRAGIGLNTDMVKEGWTTDGGKEEAETDRRFRRQHRRRGKADRADGRAVEHPRAADAR